MVRASSLTFWSWPPGAPLGFLLGPGPACAPSGPHLCCLVCRMSRLILCVLGPSLESAILPGSLVPFQSPVEERTSAETWSCKPGFQTVKEPWPGQPSLLLRGPVSPRGFLGGGRPLGCAHFPAGCGQPPRRVPAPRFRAWLPRPLQGSWASRRSAFCQELLCVAIFGTVCCCRLKFHLPGCHFGLDFCFSTCVLLPAFGREACSFLASSSSPPFLLGHPVSTGCIVCALWVVVSVCMDCSKMGYHGSGLNRRH